MDEQQKKLAKVIENYFGADAGYLDISCLDLARAILEAGWTKPVPCEECNQFAEEVVRCKDCRYAYINFFSANSGVALCRHWTNHAEGKQAITQHDDFCSYGERKDDDG